MRLLYKIIKSESVNLEEKVLITQKREAPPEKKGKGVSPTPEIDSREIDMEETKIICQKMIEKAQLESNTILEKTKKEAEELRKNTEIELKRSKAELESSGFQQGFEKGYGESISKYKELIEEARSIVTEAELYKVDTVNSMEGGIIELVTACVEKIVRKKIDENDEILLGVIRGAIETIVNRDQISIKVSHEDYEYVDMAKERLLAQFPGIRTIEIHIDDGFKKGDLEIESQSGTVNPSISQQIKKLVSEFDKLFSNEELM